MELNASLALLTVGTIVGLVSTLHVKDKNDYMKRFNKNIKNKEIICIDKIKSIDPLTILKNYYKNKGYIIIQNNLNPYLNHLLCDINNFIEILRDDDFSELCGHNDKICDHMEGNCDNRKHKKNRLLILRYDNNDNDDSKKFRLYGVNCKGSLRIKYNPDIDNVVLSESLLSDDYYSSNGSYDHNTSDHNVDSDISPLSPSSTPSNSPQYDDSSSGPFSGIASPDSNDINRAIDQTINDAIQRIIEQQINKTSKTCENLKKIVELFECDMNNNCEKLIKFVHKIVNSAKKNYTADVFMITEHSDCMGVCVDNCSCCEELIKWQKDEFLNNNDEYIAYDHVAYFVLDNQNVTPYDINLGMRDENVNLDNYEMYTIHETINNVGNNNGFIINQQKNLVHKHTKFYYDHLKNQNKNNNSKRNIVIIRLKYH